MSTIYTLASCVTPGEGVVSRLIPEGTDTEITQLVLGTATSQTHVRLSPSATEGKLGQCFKEHSGEKGEVSRVRCHKRMDCRREPQSGMEGSPGLCLLPSNGTSGAVIRQATGGLYLTAFSSEK